jgi:predicted O-methyltransferase YrrM
MLGRRPTPGPEPTLLPGTPFARVLLPLDYAPSLDYRPRWGYTRPSHPGLIELFQRDRAGYGEVIAGLRDLGPWLKAIPTQFVWERAPEPGWLGPPINALDLALLYYFVARHRPATYLEIGSGATTCFARRAVSDHGLATRIVSIDPQPRAAIDSACDEVFRCGLESVDPGLFDALRPGDVVFMDGSHRSFTNSDVTVFMLDVLPRLREGVLVHFHDIFLPDDYPKVYLPWYWNEQYLLAVYLLAARDRVRILMPSFYVSTHPDLRKSLLPPIVELPERPEVVLDGGSLWFTHVPADPQGS